MVVRVLVQDSQQVYSPSNHIRQRVFSVSVKSEKQSVLFEEKKKRIGATDSMAREPGMVCGVEREERLSQFRVLCANKILRSDKKEKLRRREDPRSNHRLNVGDLFISPTFFQGPLFTEHTRAQVRNHMRLGM